MTNIQEQLGIDLRIVDRQLALTISRSFWPAWRSSRARALLPSIPHSSWSKATSHTGRRGGVALQRRASSSSAATPLALSSAPMEWRGPS